MNILFGLLAMMACLMVQGLLILFAVRYYVRVVDGNTGGSPLFGLLVLNGIMVLLVVGILTQILIWAAMFVMLGEFPSLYEAVYHSAVNFATLGYGDIVMSDSHKILGALEAISGGMMIGATTAILMSIIQDLLKKNWSGDDHP